MHAVFDVSGMFLFIFLGSSLLRSLSRWSRSWTHRLWFSLLIMVLPLLCLLMLIVGFFRVFMHLCMKTMFADNPLLFRYVQFIMVAIVLGSVGLGMLRLLLLRYSLKRKQPFCDQGVQTCVDSVAHRHHLNRVNVQLCSVNRPLALTFGVWKPVMLLSTWMVEHLDQQELEAVIVHELEHIARYDFLINWIALVLRDAFFYLPTSRIAYRQFVKAKEVTCDDQAVRLTQRPLALASALTKVWLNLVESFPSPLAQMLSRTPESIQDRIMRLLMGDQSEESRAQKSSLLLHIEVLCLAILLLIVVNVIVHLVFIGC